MNCCPNCSFAITAPLDFYERLEPLRRFVLYSCFIGFVGLHE